MTPFLLWSNAPPEGFSPFDRIALGHGVFDTLAVCEGAMSESAAHFARLARHAAVLGIEAPAGLEAVARREIARHALPGRWRLRTTITAGEGPAGLAPPEHPQPKIAMTLSPAADPESLPPARAVFATIRRNETSPLSRIKSVNYGDALLAMAQARRAGADEAIFLNTQGRVACACAANVFARLADGTLATPPLEDGAMDGIVRARLIREGAIARALAPEDLFTGGGVFLTSSVIGMRPVQDIGGRPCGFMAGDRR